MPPQSMWVVSDIHVTKAVSVKSIVAIGLRSMTRRALISILRIHLGAATVALTGVEEPVLDVSHDSKR